MTTFHPTPVHHPLERAPASRSRRVDAETFFEPHGHGLARDAKNELQAAQAGALVIGTQNLFLAHLVVRAPLRVLAQRAPTRATLIALFAIGCAPTFIYSVAPTVITLHPLSITH